MDWNHYCKRCGQMVERVENGFKCNCTEDVLAPKETIAGWTKDARVAQLRAMHELMCNANDESIYMSWIYLMPDGATEEDFLDIAFDDDLYNECFDKFIRLIKDEGNRW